MKSFKFFEDLGFNCFMSYDKPIERLNLPSVLNTIFITKFGCKITVDVQHRCIDLSLSYDKCRGQLSFIDGALNELTKELGWEVK